MNAPLLEVELTLHFDAVQLNTEKLRYFQTLNAEFLPFQEAADAPVVSVFYSKNRAEAVFVSEDQIQIRSTAGASFPGRKLHWSGVIESFLDVFSISTITGLSLCYLNEIELHDLNSFRNYMNISFEMPPALMERIEFFRSEFTYKYDFGEIHVWLQPDWEDQSDSYCILLSLESRHVEPIVSLNVIGKIQQLHEGIKDVFHQILSRDFIERLPQ